MRITAIRFAIISALISAFMGISVWTLLFGIPMINQWEKAHNFPFGHMCDLDNSCRH